MDLLRKPDDSADSTKTLLTGAHDVGSRLIEGPQAEISNFIPRVVNRVIVHPDKVRVLFLRDALRSFLLEDNHGSGDVRKGVPVQRDSKSIACFEFAASLRRSGREVRLILSSDSEKLTSSRPSSSLLKTVARSMTGVSKLSVEKRADQRRSQRRAALMSGTSGECSAMHSWPRTSFRRSLRAANRTI